MQTSESWNIQAGSGSIGNSDTCGPVGKKNNWSYETQKVNLCIKDSWVLDTYVQAMSTNGNLTAETLAEFFYFAAETMDEISNEIENIDIGLIDWNELTKAYGGA